MEKKRILLVEDEAMLQEILSERLILRNFDVTVANNGAEALKQVSELQPDLILMDMRMPVMDGWETTRQIRADEATCSIPIIALTAHALAGDRQKALDVGCNDYESKPIDFIQLLVKMQALINKNYL